MMMAMDYIKVRSPRLALLITIALFGTTQNSYSRDFFNPELVELDNPGTEKSIFQVLNLVRKPRELSC
jgi:outer membrane usher protein